MTIEQFWYHNPNLPYFSPAYTHPDWAGASPTSDTDIYWFQIKLLEGWTAYQFDYEGLKVSIRYSAEEDFTRVEVFIPGEDKTLYKSKEDIIEDFRCSLWLCTLTDSEQLTQPPLHSLKYNVFDDLAESISAKTSESLVFGFYTGEWQTV